MSVASTAVSRARRVAGLAYRRCAAPFGLRALQQAVARGFPQRLVAPVRYLFTGELPERSRDLQSRIERRRGDIARSPATYAFAHVSTPHGPARWPIEQPQKAPGPISGRWLAESAAVPARWGAFLHLCADDPAVRTILELGSSTGISGAYLASGRSCRRLITLEGSPSLALVATASIAEVSDAAEVIAGAFDEGLTQAFARLESCGERLDLVFVDGHHDEAATIHYAQCLLPRLSPGALMIFDDIYLSQEMWRAWARLRTLQGASAAVNLGRFGILVWAGGDAAPAQFDLSRYTGWWRAGGPRYL